MFSIGWGVYLGHKVGGCKSLNFLLHARLHALKHSASSSKNNVAEKVSPDITFTFHDSVVGVLMDTILTLVVFSLSLPVRWLEEDLRAL